MPLGLLGFLGQVATAATAVRGIAQIINPEYNRPPTSITGVPGTYGYAPGAYATYGAPGSAIELAPSGSLAVTRAAGWPTWIARILLTFGPQIADAIWNEYVKRRRSGQSHAQAKAAAASAVPGALAVARTRRRMNPTNIRALRRAVRRVRSFQKTTRKVRGLFPARGGGHRVRHYVRHRRGDVDPFAAEDAADFYDTVEDLGYEPSTFQEQDDIE